jgi:hypothetical protein
MRLSTRTKATFAIAPLASPIGAVAWAQVRRGDVRAPVATCCTFLDDFADCLGVTYGHTPIGRLVDY